MILFWIFCVDYVSDRHYYVPRVRFGHTHSSSFNYVSIMCLVWLNNVPVMCCVVLVMCCSRVTDGNPVTSPFNTLCVFLFFNSCDLLFKILSKSCSGYYASIMCWVVFIMYRACGMLAPAHRVVIMCRLCAEYV